MTAYVIPTPPVVSIPVAGGGDFPVRRIYCIGRNYAAHAIEMGHDPNREPPFFFRRIRTISTHPASFRARRILATCITRLNSLLR